jgi:hypothetical protein
VGDELVMRNTNTPFCKAEARLPRFAFTGKKGIVIQGTSERPERGQVCCIKIENNKVNRKFVENPVRSAITF